MRTHLPGGKRATATLIAPLLAALLLPLLLPAPPARADRGTIRLENEKVTLRQESQKAVVLHNGTEEILILGTEMVAGRETEVLEFIPFPSEPRVSRAEGDPFAEVAALVRRKGLLFENRLAMPSAKGGGKGGAAEAVELRFSAKIGLHDVAVIRIRDVSHFSSWLEEFFEKKGIPYDAEKLDRVRTVAEDYLQRGYDWFVFDRVKVPETLRFLEPLSYRFRSPRIYYPLKTSNLLGGSGTVQLVLVLPGSVWNDVWTRTRDVFPPGEERTVELSTSAKAYPADLEAFLGKEPFFGGGKIYLQALRYRGRYEFRDDLAYDPSLLRPYPYRIRTKVDSPFLSVREESLVPPLTDDEAKDYSEALDTLGK